jgi:glucose-6-phosphate 1-epimerase
MFQMLAENKFGTVKKINLTENITGLAIEHQYCTAKISLYGGQVLAWQPNGQRPVLWLSDANQYQVGKAIRGGIPLCWPWFGAHHNDPENHSGNHGFARQQMWQIDTVELLEHHVVVTLKWQGDNMHALFPVACQLIQTLVFGENFSQQLLMSNLSKKDMDYTAALHSYIQVSNPREINIVELSTLEFDDKLTAERHSPEVFINGEGPVDRVYHRLAEQSQTMQIQDSRLQRTIEITSDNCQQWVFWNPGEFGADTMSDVHENGENEFVCLEPANTQPQKLAANSSVLIGQTISVF